MSFLRKSQKLKKALEDKLKENSPAEKNIAPPEPSAG